MAEEVDPIQVVEGLVLKDMQGAGLTEEERAGMDEFASNPENFDYFKAVYETDEKGQSLHFWAAKSIADLVFRFNSQWPFETVEQIIDWIFQVLHQKGPARTPSSIRILAQSIPHVFKGSAINRADFVGKVIESVVDFLNASQELPSFFIGLNIISTIIADLNDATENFRQSFASSYIEKLFAFSFELLKGVDDFIAADQVLGDNILNSALEVCKLCLSFEKTGSARKTPSSTQKSDSFTLPTSMNEVVSNPEVINMFLLLFANKSKPDAMNCAINICSASKNNFKPSMVPVVNQAFAFICGFYGENAVDPDSLELISKMLSALSGKFNSRIMQEIETLPQLCEVFTHVLYSVFESGSISVENNHCYLPALRFFSDIFKTASSARDEKMMSDLAPYIFPLCQKYIEYLANSAMDENAIPYIWPRSGLSMLVPQIQVFISTNPEAIVETIIGLSNEMIDAINTPGREDTINCSRRLGALLMVVSAILKNTGIRTEDVSLNNYHAHLFALAMRILQESMGWINRDDRFVELEKSVVVFTALSKEYSFFKFTAVRDCLYFNLQQIGSNIKTYEEASTLLAQRLILTLKAFIDQDIVSASIKTLGNDAILSVDAISEIISTLTTTEFPFMTSDNFMKNRISFYCHLVKSIFMKGSDCSGAIEAILGRKTEEIKLQQSPESVLSLCADIRGIFLAATDNKGDEFSVLFNWFFPDVSSFFILAAKTYMEAPGIVKQILKLFCAVVENRPHGRICFSPSSSGGNELFEACADLLSAVLDNQNALEEVPEENIKEYKYDIIKACCRLFDNLLSGGYVCFDAYRIYKVSTFNDVLAKMTVVMSTVDVSFYPNHVTAFISFIKAVCSKHIQELIEANGDFITYIINFCISIFVDYSNTNAIGSVGPVLEYIARYIVDDTYETQAISELYTANSVYIRRLIVVLWNVIFCNKSVISLVTPLKLFMLVAPEQIGEIFTAINELLPEDRRAEFLRECTEFNNDLESCLDENSNTFMGKVKSMQSFIESTGAKINLPYLQIE